MDVNGFDDYFDLRDQQEEGQEMKQQQRQQQTDSQTQPPQQVSATKEGDSYKEKGNATDTTPNVSSENTTPSWTEPNQLAESLRQESGDNIANVGSSSSSSEGANATPQQPFYFPLGGTDWANVFSTGEISGVSLASLLSAQQLQALAGDGGSFMPHLTTEAINPDLSRFIPPQMLMQSSNGPVNDSSVKKETGENQDNSSDKPQSNTAAQEANTLQEETDGRMRTRSSSRQREQAKYISKSTETISAITETPKKRSRAKKLYCTCQKPYTGEPMVQCDICKEWFHCACVDLDPDVAEDIDIWMCKKCEESGAVPERNDRNSEEAEQKQKRQPKMRKCLSRTCNNKTREDSYCSDTCAAEDAMRRTGDSEYIPSSPPASSSRRSSGASDKKTKVMTPKAKAEPPASAAISRNPEDNPIRKNVIKNMATILKTIIEGALEKDPTLFELNSSKSPKSEEPPAAKQEAEQNRQESKEAVQNNKEQEQLQQQQEDKATDKSTQAQAMADKLASSIEKAMYEQLGEPLPGSKNTTVLQCGERYKNKFRSLLHNLKDKANQVFQIRVVTGDLSPDELVKMSSEDMANPELKSMSESLRAKSIKNSVLKLSEMPIIKKTHKGDIIMLPSERDSAFPEKRRNEQQKQQQRQEEQGAVAVSSEHNESRKSSMSATPTTPTVAKDESFNDILARIGVGAENDRGGATYLDPQRPKKRKAEVDLEKLLGDDDEEFRLEMDDDEGGGGGNDENSKDASTKQDNTENDMQVDHAVPTGPPKPPVIWNGRVNMPQVAHFDAFARQIGGRTMTAQDWAEVLSPTMWLEGRIPVDRVTNYITQTQYSSSREIAILEIEPVGDDGLRSALVLLDYFNTRRRYGVVAHNKTKVKDFYLIPLRKVEQLPDCLYVVRIEETQRDVDMFLGVVVMHKSNHQQPPPVSFAHQSFQPNPYQHQQPSHPFYGA